MLIALSTGYRQVLRQRAENTTYLQGKLDGRGGTGWGKEAIIL